VGDVCGEVFLLLEMEINHIKPRTAPIPNIHFPPDPLAVGFETAGVISGFDLILGSKLADSDDEDAGIDFSAPSSAASTSDTMEDRPAKPTP
jgi:hypothetical protein